MEELIKKYLIENKTIIIPRLGALTLTNEDTLEVMFLSYLKFDDGKLSEAYANAYGCTSEEAKVVVSKWVDEIILQLDELQEVAILDIGTFVKEEDEYAFKASTIATASAPSNDEETLVVEEAADTKEIIVLTDEEPDTEEIPAIEEEEESGVEPVQEPEPEVLPQEPIVEVIEEPRSEPAIEVEEVVSHDVVVEEKEEFIPIDNTSQEKLPKEARKRRSAINKVLVLLTILLLLIGTTSIVFYEDLKTYLPFLQTEKFEKVDTKNSTSPEITSEEIEEDLIENIAQEETTDVIVENEVEDVEEVTTTEMEKAIETPKIATPILSSTENGFYVIVGSFNDRSNAERLLKGLKEKGNGAELIDNKGFYMVSIARFSTLLEAQNKNNEVGSSWIFKK